MLFVTGSIQLLERILLQKVLEGFEDFETGVK